LLSIVVVLATLAGYSMYAAALHVAATRVESVPAADMEDVFASLRQDVADQALRGVAFRNERLGEAEGYAFHIYTAQIANRGLLGADWVELAVQPEAGDILQTTPDTVSMLPGLRSGEVQALVLADKSAAAARDLTLTYFVFGRAYSIPVRVN
jgi:hypothetical protein